MWTSIAVISLMICLRGWSVRETAVHVLGKRAVVFVLAWLSFGCLLGQLYGLWSMRFFGCWVLPPAAALLVILAYVHREQADGLGSPYTWVLTGAVAGVVAAVAYDLYRLPFVLAGACLAWCWDGSAGGGCATWRRDIR